jgi:hypothetical protein
MCLAIAHWSAWRWASTADRLLGPRTQIYACGSKSSTPTRRALREPSAEYQLAGVPVDTFAQAVHGNG